MSIDAMKQALEALEENYRLSAMALLRAAIEQAEKQEPVAWLWQHSETGRTRIVMPDQIITADANWFVVGPLHLAPPEQEKQEPVDDDAYDMIDRFLRNNLDDHYYAEYSAALDRVAAPPQRQQEKQEPVAWGMRNAWGEVMDCITPTEHAREEGGYTVPLYAAPPLTNEEKQ